MSKKKVFVCYDHSEDGHYKSLVRNWNGTDEYEFIFDYRSPSVGIDSPEAEFEKNVVVAKMREAEFLFVIIRKNSSTNDWMNWEIERAKQSDVNLKLAAVLISSVFPIPPGLMDVGCKFATSFTEEYITEALDSATNAGYAGSLQRA